MKNIIFLLFALLVIIPCNLHSQELKGSWKTVLDGTTINLIFQNDAQLEFDNESYSYTIQQNYLVVRVDGQAIYYAYWFEDEKLNIYFPEGYTLQFTQTNTEVSDVDKDQPVDASTNGGKYLSGLLCYYGSSSSYSTNSSYSRTNSYNFKPNGTFEYYQEQAYSGNAGYSFNSDNSGAQRGTYKILGNQVTVTFSTGEKYVYNIHYTQSDGRITELKNNSEYYASGLCE